MTDSKEISTEAPEVNSYVQEEVVSHLEKIGKERLLGGTAVRLSELLGKTTYSEREVERFLDKVLEYGVKRIVVKKGEVIDGKVSIPDGIGVTNGALAAIEIAGTTRNEYKALGQGANPSATELDRWANGVLARETGATTCPELEGEAKDLYVALQGFKLFLRKGLGSTRVLTRLAQGREAQEMGGAKKVTDALNFMLETSPDSWKDRHGLLEAKGLELTGDNQMKMVWPEKTE